MAHRLAAALLGILLASCTSVYVQTGGGSIERSTDFERSVRGRANTSTTPAKPPPVEDEKR